MTSLYYPGECNHTKFCNDLGYATAYAHIPEHGKKSILFYLLPINPRMILTLE